MQGYIVHLNRVKDEDLIVHILTDNKIKSTYRFYGARHSVIYLGYKIDFEPHYNLKSSLPQLRNVLHLAHPWNSNRERMMLWQQFIGLFYSHLKELEGFEGFYTNLLDWCALRWEKQNPKRIAIEAYLSLLRHEGRLHDPSRCFLCDGIIEQNVALARGFLPAHPNCLHVKGLDQALLENLFLEQSTLHVNDLEIEYLWKILLEGL
jgi:recombinational DNA repair protein (RecF pathway)